MSATAASLLAAMGVALVVLFFGFAALYQMMRELQEALLSAGGDRGLPAILDPVWPSPSPHGTVVLFVTASCSSCRDCIDLLQDSEELSDMTEDLVVLSADDKVDSWMDSRAIIDATLVGSLGLQAAPTLIHFDASGRQTERTLVGNKHDLAKALQRMTT